jgi:hypothetical protein
VAILEDCAADKFPGSTAMTDQPLRASFRNVACYQVTRLDRVLFALVDDIAVVSDLDGCAAVFNPMDDRNCAAITPNWHCRNSEMASTH